MPKRTTDVRAAVRERFGVIATSPEQEKNFPIGPATAEALEYDADEIDRLPLSVTESFVGVTNVLWKGLDGLLAAQKIGPTDKLIGAVMSET